MFVFNRRLAAARHNPSKLGFCARLAQTFVFNSADVQSIFKVNSRLLIVAKSMTKSSSNKGYNTCFISRDVHIKARTLILINPLDIPMSFVQSDFYLNNLHYQKASWIKLGQIVLLPLSNHLKVLLFDSDGQ